MAELKARDVVVEMEATPLRLPAPSETSDSAPDEYFPVRSVSSTSSHPSFMAHQANDELLISPPKTTVSEDLVELFAENILAKIYRTATRSAGTDTTESPGTAPHTSEPIPNTFPEYVPQDGPNAGSYTLREAEFWTCGFFPGTLHGILERLVRFPHSIDISSGPPGVGERPDIATLRARFLSLCNAWAEPLHAMADRTDTHDVGFIVMPALRTNWELTGNPRSFDSIVRAAGGLASRYVPSARAIRSWDARIQKNIEITGTEDNLILIIDSLCNLDLLYYASKQSADGGALAEIATAHATTLLGTHLRPESIRSSRKDAYGGQWYSTRHVTNLDPKTGEVKRRFTAQGYSDDSTWARGQSWAILGYAQTYMWTKDEKFLQASAGLAEYFLHRLDTAPDCVEVDATDAVCGGAPCRHHKGRYVPLWDFDAPTDGLSGPIRDSSAGAIAANGMLVLSQALAGLGSDRLAARFRVAAIDIVRDILLFALAPEKARLVSSEDRRVAVEDVTPGQTFEAILKFGTANNNENAQKQYANHGLVYGDYYLVEFGNRLLRMGLD